MARVLLKSEANTKELVLIEFQGEFEHPDFPEGQFQGIELGKLSEKSGGNYELLIGNHLL